MVTTRETLCAAALTLLVASPAAASWPHHPFENLAVSTAVQAQTVPQVVLDGGGGAIVVWQDARGGVGNDDIYAQHVLASGVLDPAWPATGRLVCGAVNAQINPVAVTDAFGGVIIAWTDYRDLAVAKVYARRVLASGANDPAWPADGRAMCGAATIQLAPVITGDGSGGAIVVWQDSRGGANADDIYAQHVASNGVLDSNWPIDGLAVVAANSAQTIPAITPDYASGAIVTWADTRTSSAADIYAQHVLANGVVDAAWPANGRLVFDASGLGAALPMIVTDASGGAVVGSTIVGIGGAAAVAHHVLATGTLDPAWPAAGRQFPVASASGAQLSSLVPDWAGGALAVLQEYMAGATYDLVGHHVLGTGGLDPAWPATGRALCRAAGNQVDAKAIFDNAGGMFVTWRDHRGGTIADIYAHRMLASGVADPAWPVDGRAVCTNSSDQASPAIAPDLMGGVVIAWTDARNGSSDIFAQNITTFGVLGDPEPVVTAVGDLPNDQGGRVRIRWNASQMDASPYFEIGTYGIWREVTEAAARQALARGARFAATGSVIAAERGVYRTSRSATATTWWEGVGSVPARGEANYTFVADTFQDSTGAGNPLTTFMVDAHALLQPGWWDSAPLSGYSVDNLPPAAPAPFTGQYVAGTAHLHWNPNAEDDLAGYRLYRGSSVGFVPGPGNLLAALADTGYADPAGTQYVYKLTAIDIHGNESVVATLQFSGPTDVGGGVAPRELSFSAPRPNPASAGAVLDYALPNASRIRLAVYDAAGRLVRELVSGAREAGAYTEAWDLRNDAGRRVGAGLYFARLDVEGQRALTRRIAITH